LDGAKPAYAAVACSAAFEAIIDETAASLHGPPDGHTTAYGAYGDEPVDPTLSAKELLAGAATQLYTWLAKRYPPAQYLRVYRVSLGLPPEPTEAPLSPPPPPDDAEGRSRSWLSGRNSSLFFAVLVLIVSGCFFLLLCTFTVYRAHKGWKMHRALKAPPGVSPFSTLVVTDIQVKGVVEYVA
jgi:hypothetical protein